MEKVNRNERANTNEIQVMLLVTGGSSFLPEDFDPFSCDLVVWDSLETAWDDWSVDALPGASWVAGASDEGQFCRHLHHHNCL